MSYSGALFCLLIRDNSNPAKDTSSVFSPTTDGLRRKRIPRLQPMLLGQTGVQNVCGIIPRGSHKFCEVTVELQHGGRIRMICIF